MPGQLLGQGSDLLPGFLTFLSFIHFTSSYKFFFSEHVDVVLTLSKLVFTRYTVRIAPGFLAVLSQILYDFSQSVRECRHSAINAATVSAYQILAY